MGIWDAPELAALREPMPGQSLLRPLAEPAARHPDQLRRGIFSCAFKNWGAMRGKLKLLADENNSDWRCFDVARDDPTNAATSASTRAATLRELAEGEGRGSPF